MSNYMTYGIVALGISLLLNVFFVWYIKNLLSRLYFVTNNLGDLVEATVSFRDHLFSVHELDMFYGDEVLTGLIAHVGEYTEILSEFEEIYTLLDEEPEEETDVDDNENTAESAKNPFGTKEETQAKNQANVFYAGTRRRDS